MSQAPDKPKTASNPPDGPVAPDAFAWAGKTYEGMRPTSWRLVARLWDSNNRTAHLDDLAFPVFDEHSAPPRERYAPVATRANQFFRWNSLPFSLRVKNRHLQLIQHPD